MKTNIKTLLETIQYGIKTYGEDFLNWEYAIEQHPNYKNCSNCNTKDDFIFYTDECLPKPKGGFYKTLFIKSHSMGCNTYFKKQKIFGIQIHF